MVAGLKIQDTTGRTWHGLALHTGVFLAWGVRWFAYGCVQWTAGAGGALSIIFSINWKRFDSSIPVFRFDTSIRTFPLQEIMIYGEAL